MNHSLATLGCCAVALLSTMGCAQKQLASYPIAVRVESDPGKPLAHVRIKARGELLGESDEAGAVQLALMGKPGDVVLLDTECPAGHDAPKSPTSVVLRPLVDARSPEYRVACRPQTRAMVVAVRAQNGAGLPLRYLGRELARTDDAGTAHALLDVAPGETVTLTLDTSAQPKLMPKNPELKVVVPERDEIVVFDERFALPKAKKKHVRVEPVGPERIR